jgi:hypothetical protein
MGYVGRFLPPAECVGPLERGQVVVIQTDRGIELGEVLIGLDDLPESPSSDRSQVLRRASPEDLAEARRADTMRSERFALCQRILQEGDWPWELIDVELMLDGRDTVLHYLGPHQLDASTLRARFRMTCVFDVVFEPVGVDLENEALEEFSPASGGHAGCQRCGGSDGGCGSGGCRQPANALAAPPAPSAALGGCATARHSGCTSCGISRLLAGRKESGERQE